MKLLLVTTSGCAACNIQDGLIRKAIKDSGKLVEYERKDVKEISPNLLKALKITDFPTTIIYVDGEIKFHFSGTRPSIVIERYMEVNKG